MMTQVTEPLAAAAERGTVLGVFGSGTLRSPSTVAFDGHFIWIGNRLSGTVTKFALDGTVLGNFAIDAAGGSCEALAFDGENIWAGASVNVSVVKFNLSIGSSQSFYIGRRPLGLAFDGSNIWVATGPFGVTKLRASDGTVVGSYNTGVSPVAIAFDGANVWVANNASNDVTKR